MKLGIFINTDRHLGDVLGIVDAALDLGHSVSIFNMDTGTKLLNDEAFSSLCTREGVTMSFCELNATGLGVPTEGLDPSIVCGSQYDNATMMHDADRVIRL